MKRLRNPLYWGVILAVCAIWTVVPWTFGLGDAHLHMVLSPLYGSLVILMIFPMPWQWSSDDRPLAPFPRGLAQALVWNAVWALALVSLTLVFHGKERFDTSGAHGHGHDDHAAAHGHDDHGA
ncbi:MAG: hypothetical protein H6Q00_2736, partial [Holophagaceae bacterium]|nr:hypothetical protein [Holophagaceae bacterium]